MAALHRKPVLTLFASIVLISVYFLMNVFTNISVKNNYSMYSTFDESIGNVSQIKSDLFNSTIGEIQSKVNETDQYLRRMSTKKTRPDSRLIYPDEVYAMTKMTINQMPCSEQLGKDLTLIVMVFNRPEAFARRQIIRETWGQAFSDNNKTRIYFTIGRTKDPAIEELVIKENQKFSDILQFDYYESYYNCTIKAIGLLRWTALNCPFVKHMLKVDDDSLVVPNNLLQYTDNSPADSISGYLWHKPVVRRGTDKWSINDQDYPHNYYPDYIGGPYLIPGPTILALYQTAVTQCLPALPFEDVYITGVVANKQGVGRKHMSSLMLVWNGCHPLKLDYCFYKNHAIFWQQFDDKSIRNVWNKFISGSVCPSDGHQRC